MVEKPCLRSSQLVTSGTRHPRAPFKQIRRIYERAFGPIPAGHHIHHACKNPSCVEPSHLQAVTPRQHVDAHRYNGLALGFNETAFA